MEIVDVCTKSRNHVPLRNTAFPCKIKCTKRYVQPPRVKSYAPERVYKPTTALLDSNTTYHLSYLNVDKASARYAKSQPIRPMHGIEKIGGKFSDETTTNLSYKPIAGIVRPDPIIPKQKMMVTRGKMEDVTTFRTDYMPKQIEKTSMIIPCGSIRTSTGELDGRTTAGLSYLHPGQIEPVVNYKPVRKYCPPTERIPTETTQKLSYQPFCVTQKEEYPWAKKMEYTRPEAAMCSETIYRESFLQNPKPVVVKPILPQNATHLLSTGAEFSSETVYKGSYMPCGSIGRVASIVPCGSIEIPDAKMTNETINKLSYKSVWQPKRDPILPRSRTMIQSGRMQSETTTRSEFPAKNLCPPQLIIPCDNITTSKAPLEETTTTALSYMCPGSVEPVPSFKPIRKYCRPSNKIEDSTINKLSYQQWPLQPKQDVPWAHKGQYEPPKEQIAGDTVYHMSYPPPGFFVDDDCAAVECMCPNGETNQTAPVVLQTCNS